MKAVCSLCFPIKLNTKLYNLLYFIEFNHMIIAVCNILYSRENDIFIKFNFSQKLFIIKKTYYQIQSQLPKISNRDSNFQQSYKRILLQSNLLKNKLIENTHQHKELHLPHKVLSRVFMFNLNEFLTVFCLRCFYSDTNLKSN